MSTCTIHGPGCERLHVDDRVAIFGEPERTGTVFEVSGERIHVRLDELSYRAFGNTALTQSDLWFNEAELVKLTPEGAILAIMHDVLADSNWTARVVAAAIVAQNHVERDSAAWNVLDGALTGKAVVF